MSTSLNRPQLLVSVRSVNEALTALDGGAELIDVKEPSRGPLGAADSAVIAAIIRSVGERAPVSAAMGEWIDYTPCPSPEGLSFAKWGLARLATSARQAAGRIRETTGPSPVLVAYADHYRAGSPSIEELVQAACDLKFPVLLIDTAIKDSSTLLDWMSIETMTDVRKRLDEAGTSLALAGSLTEASLERLMPVTPRWFAVRGAACDGGREGVVSSNQVRKLRSLIEDLYRPVAD